MGTRPAVAVIGKGIALYLQFNSTNAPHFSEKMSVFEAPSPVLIESTLLRAPLY